MERPVVSEGLSHGSSRSCAYYSDDKLPSASMLQREQTKAFREGVLQAANEEFPCYSDYKRNMIGGDFPVHAGQWRYLANLKKNKKFQGKFKQCIMTSEGAEHDKGIYRKPPCSAPSGPARGITQCIRFAWSVPLNAQTLLLSDSIKFEEIILQNETMDTTR